MLGKIECELLYEVVAWRRYIINNKHAWEFLSRQVNMQGTYITTSI